MIPVATSRLFLLVAMLLAAVLGVSGVALVVNRGGVSSVRELTLMKAVASFRGEMASPSPEPTTLITSDLNQTEEGQVLGSTEVSVKAFPPLIFPAYPQNPFLPQATASVDPEEASTEV